jgi:hypothetical protein
MLEIKLLKDFLTYICIMETTDMLEEMINMTQIQDEDWCDYLCAELYCDPEQLEDRLNSIVDAGQVRDLYFLYFHPELRI